jgi:hypothetical protein
VKQNAVLVLGCGNSFRQNMSVQKAGDEAPGPTFQDNFEEVITIDFDPAVKPTYLWDLNEFPWPCPKGYFNEVHAYECLEHLGQVGDAESFFALYRAIWDALTPGGLLCATTPWWESIWAWQDPGHKRVYSGALLAYLSQEEYADQVGRTSITDYRRFWPAPYSFKARYMKVGEVRNGVEVPADQINPKNAGFSFILSKEVYVPQKEGGKDGS